MLNQCQKYLPARDSGSQSGVHKDLNLLGFLVSSYESRFVRCCNVDTLESSSEIPGKFSNVVLEKNGEDQLDRSYEK
jgi:hypothetical protein